jgi:hypothetical protein
MEAEKKGDKSPREGYFLLDEEDVQKIIEDFFNEYIELTKNG